jgi:hypothetical protein
MARSVLGANRSSICSFQDLPRGTISVLRSFENLSSYLIGEEIELRTTDEDRRRKILGEYAALHNFGITDEERSKIIVPPLPEELLKNFRGHQQWLDTRGEQGKRLDLRSADYPGVDLRNRTLREGQLEMANFSDGNLSGADLSRATCRFTNLRGANLGDTHVEGADFSYADLRYTNWTGSRVFDTAFSAANLEHSNLEAVTGLRPEQLAGTNLSDARLPLPFVQYFALNVARDRLRRTIGAFLMLAIVSGYLVIAVSQLDDLFLVAYKQISLPGTRILFPAPPVFVVATILIGVLSWYFQFLVHSSWSVLAKLPATFPDGESLADKFVYPFGSLRRKESRSSAHNTDARQIIRVILDRIAILVQQTIGPISLVTIWSRYLLLRDLVGTMAQVLIITITIAFTFVFLINVDSSYRVEDDSRGTNYNRFSPLRLVGLILSPTILFLISFSIIYAKPGAGPSLDPSSWIPLSLSSWVLIHMRISHLLL